MTREKINDLKKHLNLYPPEARQFYEKLLENKTKDMYDDIDGFSADDFEA